MDEKDKANRGLRSDFGLKYNMILEAGGVAIGDQVHITIDTEFTRQA